MDASEKLLDYIKRLHNECLVKLQAVSFDKTHPRAVHLMNLYGTIMELTGCIIGLTDNNLRSGVPSIFRTMLEAYVELKNLYEKAEYGYHMEANSTEQSLKLLNEAKKGINPYLRDMAKSLQNIDLIIQEHENKRDSLKAKGFSCLSIFDRFLEVGLIDLCSIKAVLIDK